MLSNKGDNERRLTCPYEPSHILLIHRMQTHLVKCRRNHPESKKVPCLFNSTHQVPEPELAYHYEVCVDRGNLDKFMYTTEKTNPDRFPIPPELNVQSLESWDDENHPTYDPEEYCRNNLILRNNVIHTQSAAVRRNFRLEERQRVQELMDQRTLPTNQNGNRPEVSQRRPVGASEGIQNRAELVDSDPFDITNLMAKVHLGSSTLTTPRLSATVTAEPEEEINNDNENEIPNRGLEPVSHAQTSDAREPNRSTGAIPRTDVSRQHNNDWFNRSSATRVPRTQNATSNENESQAPNRSTGAVPRVVDPFVDDDFPQLGAPRSLMSRNGTNLSRPVGRGRGSRLAKN